MFSTKYPNNIRTVSGPNVAVFNNDVVLAVNTSTGACSINLNAIPAGYWSTQWKLYIYDANNNAGTNNITINAGVGQTINNSSSLVLSTNGAGAVISVINNTSFIATLSSGSGGITTLTVKDTPTVDLTLTPISGGYQLEANTIQRIYFTDQITPLQIDSNGYRVLYPFTATEAGDYIFDATTLTETGNDTGESDFTTFAVVNGTAVTNSNSPYRTFLNVSTPNTSLQITHTQKVKVTLAIGDTFYYGASASLSPVIVNKGSMIIFKIN